VGTLCGSLSPFAAELSWKEAARDAPVRHISSANYVPSTVAAVTVVCLLRCCMIIRSMHVIINHVLHLNTNMMMVLASSDDRRDRGPVPNCSAISAKRGDDVSIDARRQP
jgi:hypothetical protein